MKKRVLFLLPTVILVGILFIVLPSLLRGCCLFYDTLENVDGWSVAVNRAGRVCFVGNYSWDGSEERMTLRVPDSCNGYPITTLGGYFGRGVPAPFRVTLPEEYCNTSIYSWLPDDGSPVQTLRFTIILGNNICEIQNLQSQCYYKFVSPNGEAVYTQVTYYLECSPDNPAFYSEDGRLFEKKTGSLVKDLITP